MENTELKKIEYNAFNKHIFKLIPKDIVSLLDVGCGTGGLGKAIKQAYPSIRMTGITFSTEEARQANVVYEKIFIYDINNVGAQIEGSWDCIVFSHILEHTYHPGTVLSYYASFLSEKGTIIIGLPNVLFFKQRFQFLKGNFKYNNNGGLMDNTHYRFYDYETARQLVKNSGLEIVKARGQGAFPLGIFRKLLPSVANKIDNIAVAIFPGLFSFQFLIMAQSKKR